MSVVPEMAALLHTTAEALQEVVDRALNETAQQHGGATGPVTERTDLPVITGLYSTTLTPRETEVVQAIWDGLTVDQIASRLIVSPRTVGNHIASIFNKFGVSDRVSAIRVAIERGVISPAAHEHRLVHYCQACKQFVGQVA